MPTPNPVTPLVFNVGVVIVAAPETTVQLPVPIPGKLPVNVALATQTVCEAPAFEIVGGGFLIMATVEVVAGHTPLDIVHWNTFVPTDKKLIADVGELGDKTAPLPEIKDHVPVPTVAVFAAKVALNAHTDCVGPALAIVGKSSRTTATVDIEAAHTPLVIRHLNTFVPTPNPVIVVFGKVGEVIVPAPETKVQLPVPTAAVFAFIVAEVAHTV